MLWVPERGEEHKLDDFIEDLEQFMMDADPTLVRHLHEGWERHQKRMYKTLDANDPKVFMLRFLDTLRQTVEENERTDQPRRCGKRVGSTKCECGWRSYSQKVSCQEGA